MRYQVHSKLVNSPKFQLKFVHCLLLLSLNASDWYPNRDISLTSPGRCQYTVQLTTYRYIRLRSSLFGQLEYLQFGNGNAWALVRILCKFLQMRSMLLCQASWIPTHPGTYVIVTGESSV